MAKVYTVTFNDVVLLKSSTKKGAFDFMKTLNKNNMRIKTIVAKIEADGGQVFGTVYVDKIEGDYNYPIKSKRL